MALAEENEGLAHETLVNSLTEVPEAGTGLWVGV